MANETQLQLLQEGVEAWNEWRRFHSAVEIDLSGADLSQANLSGANLSYVHLSDAQLSRTDLSNTNLFSADLTSADLTGANLCGANLNDANLNDANLRGVDLTGANLNDADLSSVNLSDARLPQAFISRTIFTNLDLRGVIGLDDVRHLGPSEISISTIYRSEGQIPEIFLRGCGVPESFIVQIPSLVGATQPIKFYSCFISYSGRDEDFARRLHSRMREAGLRVWFAPEDIRGGDKLYDQIDRAIQVHDRLLLVLSESSLQSKWVETEIRRARKVELKEGRRKLFPIRLVSYETLQEWVCIDSTTGEDLAGEVRSYSIPDFAEWKSHDHLEGAFARLLADLKASV